MYMENKYKNKIFNLNKITYFLKYFVMTIKN